MSMRSTSRQAGLAGSGAARSLHINTSHDRMPFAAFRMPRSLPDFPAHERIAEYFGAYVDQFRFRDRITFETAVERVGIAANRTGEVTLESGEARSFDALIVANGHHWGPRWPELPFPGSEEFAGGADPFARLQGRRPGTVPRPERRPRSEAIAHPVGRHRRTRAVPHHVRTAIHHRLREDFR